MAPAGAGFVSAETASRAFGRVGDALALALRAAAPPALALALAGVALGLLGLRGRVAATGLRSRCRSARARPAPGPARDGHAGRDALRGLGRMARWRIARARRADAGAIETPPAGRRERGQAPHSAELTAAAGLLAASALLGVWGDDLALALLGSLPCALSGTPIVSADAAEVVARLREMALGVAVPFFGMIAGVVVAALAAHQAQVGLLWAPSLIAPDPSRLWGIGQGPDLVTRAVRGRVGAREDRGHRPRGRLGDPLRVGRLPAPWERSTPPRWRRPRARRWGAWPSSSRWRPWSSA